MSTSCQIGVVPGLIKCWKYMPPVPVFSTEESLEGIIRLKLQRQVADYYKLSCVEWA